MYGLYSKKANKIGSHSVKKLNVATPQTSLFSNRSLTIRLTQLSSLTRERNPPHGLQRSLDNKSHVPTRLSTSFSTCLLETNGWFRVPTSKYKLRLSWSTRSLSCFLVAEAACSFAGHRQEAFCSGREEQDEDILGKNQKLFSASL